MDVKNNKIDQLEKSIDLVKSEVDAIQVTLMKASRAWYKEATALVAILALLFSFGTTAVSFYKASQAEVINAQNEFRKMILQLHEFPINYTELRAKYKNDADSLQIVQGNIDSQLNVIVQQAVKIIEQYPKLFNASEYLSLASALKDTTNFSSAEHYFNEAIKRSDQLRIEVMSLRGLAFLNYSRSDYNEGRKCMKKSNMIIESNKYNIEHSNYKIHTKMHNELFWSRLEILSNDKDKCLSHFKKAMVLFGKLPPALDMSLPGQIQDIARHIMNRFNIDKSDFDIPSSLFFE